MISIAGMVAGTVEYGRRGIAVSTGDMKVSIGIDTGIDKIPIATLDLEAYIYSLL